MLPFGLSASPRSLGSFVNRIFCPLPAPPSIQLSNSLGQTLPFIHGVSLSQSVGAKPFSFKNVWSRYLFSIFLLLHYALYQLSLSCFVIPLNLTISPPLLCSLGVLLLHLAQSPSSTESFFPLSAPYCLFWVSLQTTMLVIPFVGVAPPSLFLQGCPLTRLKP